MEICPYMPTKFALPSKINSLARSRLVFFTLLGLPLVAAAPLPSAGRRLVSRGAAFQADVAQRSRVPRSEEARSGWRLIWSDEFDGPENSAPDDSKWSYDVGGGGWGNAELETYTKDRENAFLDGKGHLIIRARRSEEGRYTSSRLKTLGKFGAQHGRIEARMLLPDEPGLWPAFWLLGADISSVQWPLCGEIDIMEHIGKEPTVVHGTIHGPGYSGAAGISRSYSLLDGRKFSEAFHTFAIIWDVDNIEFFVDGESLGKATPADLPPGKEWVFNKPFFILLNLAVGGRWPGNPEATAAFPQDLTIDYVRVYQKR
jgi:beta-glucanase (GH16 family)